MDHWDCCQMIMHINHSPGKHASVHFLLNPAQQVLAFKSLPNMQIRQRKCDTALPFQTIIHIQNTAPGSLDKSTLYLTETTLMYALARCCNSYFTKPGLNASVWV